MSSNIQSYKDLLEEKERLQNLLLAKKIELQTNVELLKEQYKLVVKAASFINDITTKDRSHPWMNMVASFLINTVVKGKLLANAGWIYKLAVPFALKNYVSNLFAKKVPVDD